MILFNAKESKIAIFSGFEKKKFFFQIDFFSSLKKIDFFSNPEKIAISLSFAVKRIIYTNVRRRKTSNSKTAEGAWETRSALPTKGAEKQPRRAAPYLLGDFVQGNWASEYADDDLEFF
jgi:hypothetical protein